MLLCLCGGTGVGKDSILKVLTDKYGYEKIVTYTTRPMREGEIDGVDYHYIDKKVFDSLCAGDFFAETTSYKVINDEVWEYGTAHKDLAPNKIVILNPSGLKELKKDKSLDILAIYLYASYGEIWNRLRQRGDNLDEVTRRLEADKKDFDDINEYVDFAIRTDGQYSKDEIANLINYLYERSKHTK